MITNAFFRFLLYRIYEEEIENIKYEIENVKCENENVNSKSESETHCCVVLQKQAIRSNQRK